MVLRAIVRLLGRHFEVSSTDEPLQALEMLRINPDSWDAVVSDVSMLGLDGFALQERVRKFSESLAGKFIFISGGGESPELRTKLDHSEYVSKGSVNSLLISSVLRMTGIPISV
jgi:CheY-like chemotaxis protein